MNSGLPREGAGKPQLLEEFILIPLLPGAPLPTPERKEKSERRFLLDVNFVGL